MTSQVRFELESSLDLMLELMDHFPLESGMRAQLDDRCRGIRSAIENSKPLTVTSPEAQAALKELPHCFL